MKKNKLIWLALYVIIFLMYLQSSLEWLDPDFGWHLKVGQDILQEKSVPRLDYYNYTLEGKEWLNHEWLADMILFVLFDKLGYLALTIIFGLLFTGFIFLLKKYCEKILANKYSLAMLAFFLFAGIKGVLPHTGVRVQELGMIFLFFVILLLSNYLKQKKSKYLAILVFVFYLWANVHASFIFGLFVFLSFLLYRWLETLVLTRTKLHSFQSPHKLNLKQLTQVSLFFTLSVISTLFTPYGTKIIELLERIHVSGAFHLSFIAEWKPLYSLPFNYPALFYLAIFFSALIIWIYENRKKLLFSFDPWQLMLSLLLAYLTFQTKRHFPLFFVASMPVLVVLGKDIIKNNMPPKKLGLRPDKNILNFFLFAIALSVMILFVLSSNYTNKPFENKKYLQYYPYEAVQFLKSDENYAKLRLFNVYDWGGYMIWVWPEKKLFADGRLPQYPINNQTLLQEYADFFDEEKVADKLEEYEIEMVMTQKTRERRYDKFEKWLFRKSPKNEEEEEHVLAKHLEESKDWQQIYEDKISLVFVKNEFVKINE